MESNPKTDVVIAGAGIAGAVAAWALHEHGLSVTLVDPKETASPVFKAERLSRLAAEILTELKVVDQLERLALPLHSTATIKDSKVETVTRNKDYSIPLWRLVSQLRTDVSCVNGVQVIIDRVDKVEASSTGQKIVLDSGDELECKLLVVATGASTGLLKHLGIEREIISLKHSSTFGFDIEPGEGFQLPTDSVSVRLCKDGVDYMNIFPTMDGRYRANLFTYWPAGGSKTRAMIKSGVEELNALLQQLAPELKKVTGQWKAVGKVECGSVSVMKSSGYQCRPGVVLIGDAYGRICPCSGMGINKALNDVLTLSRCAPEWLRSNTPLNWSVLSEYYEDEKRVEYEEYLYSYSLFIRKRLLSKHPLWFLRRWYYHHVPTQVKSWIRQFRDLSESKRGDAQTV